MERLRNMSLKRALLTLALGNLLAAFVLSVTVFWGCMRLRDTLTPSDTQIIVGAETEFEKSLLENYGVAPDHYEDLGDGIYQVYVKIDGKIIPYVTVDSATGDYHG